ncbi:MAG TPA: hypothetical protein VLQ93_05460 [Myxococcaceae bacterium]|nr:hypothetical protein [Myxococcaceae bacterium]
MRSPLPLLLLLLTLPSLTAAAPFPVTASPEQVVLGQDTKVLVQVKVPRGAGPLRAVASSGSLMPLPTTARGVYAYRWVPPDIRYPLLAVLAFWVETPEGPPELTTLHIPLLGRTELEASTAPGAEVVVELGGRRFGPVQANRKGRVRVPVEVPPGAGEARLLATSKGLQTDRIARLDLPPERPLLALLGPDVFPSNGSGWLVLHGQEPAPASEVELKVEGASLEAVDAARGLFRVKPSPEARAVVVDARWKDGTGSARAMAPVVAPIVAHVSPTPSPPPALSTGPALPALPPLPRGLSFHVLAGGFFATGDNVGPLVGVGASLPLALPVPLLEGRLSAELEVGLRRAASTVRIEGLESLGELDSRVLAVPVLLSARARVLERGPLALYARAGLGVMAYSHELSSELVLLEPSHEQRLGPMGFLAAQGAWRFGSLSALVELRGGYGPAHTTKVRALLEGISLALGVRYTP